jgi:hypothetical protein
MAMHKYGCLTEHEPQAEDFLYQLGDAAVRIDLLRVKPSHTVTLSLDAVVDGIMETNNRGMIVYINRVNEKYCLHLNYFCFNKDILMNKTQINS